MVHAIHDSEGQRDYDKEMAICLAARSLLASAILLLGHTPALAHEMRPGYLGIRETAPEEYAVLWKVPARGDERLRIAPILPEACVARSPTTTHWSGDAQLQNWTIHCPGGLAGHRIAIAGLARAMIDVVARIELRAGLAQTYLLRPAAPAFVVAGPQPWGAVAAEYLAAGIQHILLGIDHLLFVLGLLCIIRGRWILLKTVTAFTVAHSATLAAATLGFASVPEQPLNAVIALSILFLGPEMVRARRGGTSLTLCRPWVIAFGFGLLHGFGFASGLSTAGLQGSDLGLALLMFNLGVEAGQVGFIGLVLMTGAALRVLQVRCWWRWVELMPAYTVGSLGAYWTIQRTAILVAGG
jgi:hypothetical protein